MFLNRHTSTDEQVLECRVEGKAHVTEGRAGIAGQRRQVDDISSP